MSPKVIAVPNWLLFWAAAVTFRRFIFVRVKFKDDPVVLAHETIHTLQYAREGWLKFLFLYWLVFPALWNPWRARWEAEAYAVNVRAGAPIDWAMKTVAGPLYLWPCRHDQALALLKEYVK